MAAFLANYRCGTGAAGAQTLNLALVVSTPMSDPTQAPTVGGVGTITQATNPPLDLNTNISGIVHMLNGPTAVAMAGTSVTGQQNFQGVLVLPQGWGKPGSVTYWYARDGQPVHVGPVDAQPVKAQNAA
ncbi:MAG: DUF1842 domain-containing protein [Acidobacteriota bacterium]|nr:DUF1842 domain-containing protein [Acidobacteriota bacterium]